MPSPTARLNSSLAAVDRALGALRKYAWGPLGPTLDRWRSDAEAIQFHLQPRVPGRPILAAILGGTGTGKSTLVNRLLGVKLSATSFRRTFTSGAVAITSDPANLPDGWLGIEHRMVAENEIPARGQADALAIVKEDRDQTRKVTLIDTPDLDGDQPQHHTQADRVFRWAQALVFLVTPEKYQMTELLPYYRLARRYSVPSLFVMNKAEEAEVVEDFRQQLIRREWQEPKVFALPRDDAAWEPDPEFNLYALRDAVMGLEQPDELTWRAGVTLRIADLLDRLQDQVLTPLREERRQVDQLVAAVRALETPAIGVDVNPLTEQLQRRLQQRSVLYLMGPRRVLERVRQVPGMVLRLPRTIWDVLVRGQKIRIKDPERRGAEDANGDKVPDFATAVSDQFTIVQSRVEDVLRSSMAGQRWLTEREEAYKAVRIDPQEAGRAAQEELAELEKWLDSRWNATPRDTMLLMRLLRHLPGGDKLTRWTEAAPYLLAVIVATHHAFFGPVDLMVLGGFSLATWLTEKLSNEVAQRARATNKQIAQRFADLAHTQIEQVCAWLEEQAPAERDLAALESAAEAVGAAVEYSEEKGK